MKHSFINQEGTSNKFWNIEVIGKKFTVTYGKIGTKGTSSEKKFSSEAECLKEAEKLIAEKLKKGYKEVKEGGKPSSDELPTSSKKGLKLDYNVITYKEAEKKYAISDYYSSGGPEPEDKVLVFEGDTVIDGNFELIQHEMPHEAWGYIVTGNLTVNGRILDGDMDYGPFLVVKGDLYADSITTAGAELFIIGNAFIKKFIYTFYNHGTLEIDGDLKTKLVICSDHNTIVKGKIDAIVLNDNGSLEGTPDFDEENWGEILKEDIIAEDYLDDDVIMEHIRKGKNFLTKKYATLFDEDVKIESFVKKGSDKATSIVQEAIDKITAKGKKVEALKIVNKKLTEIPDILFELKDLKKLDLSENPISKIPPDIKKLTKLETLILKECKLTNLPDEIGELTQLQELDISSNSMMEYNGQLKLGEWVGKLKNLKVLCCDYNLCFPFPDSIRQLKNLEELSLYQCSDGKEVDFPEVITQLTSLKKLKIGSNSFRTIPQSITKLLQLEELNLGSSLCYVNELPDLSGLTKLKTLHADGNQSFTERPFSKQHLVKSFLTIPNLEELHLDRFGEETISVDLEELQELIKKAPEILKKDMSKVNFDEDEELNGDTRNICLFIQEKGKDVMSYYNKEDEELRVRDDLNPDYLKGVGNLKKIRILDLSFNGLTSLPEEIYQLKDIQYINLEYNNLPVSQRAKLKTHFPIAQFNFSNNTSPHASDEKYFNEMIGIIKKANKLMTEKKSINELRKALTLYDQALEYFDSGKVVDEYNLLYAYYGKGYTYAYLNNFLVESKSKEVEKTYKEAIEVSSKILALIPPLESIWHFTDLGAFQKEACRFASNSVAWDMHKLYNDSDQLEKALELVEKGVKCIENESHYYIYDTKVRILLKLKRVDEAYKIVKKVLSKDSDFYDFQDIKGSAAYKKWIKENQ